MSAHPLSVFAAAREVPQRPFLVAEREHCFLEVAERAARVNAALKRLGIAAGERGPVAFVAQERLDTLLLLLALMELGVPAFPLHPRWSGSERQRALSKGANTPFCARLIEVPSLEASAPEALPEPLEHDPERLLAVLHTSGSSGQPEGVELSRRAFLASAAASAENLGWEPVDRWLCCLPLCHVGGLSILVRCLVARRTLVLASSDALAAPGVTLASLVPTQLSRWLERNERVPPSLRAVLVGGSALSAPLFQRALDRGLPVLATYGSTETCSQLATQRPGTRATGHVGRPLRGVDVRFVGPHLEVRTPTLASGLYPNRPLPRGPDGWFRTPDVGELTEAGELRILGRSDDVLITGGENVFPGEVEAALLEHPEVRAACVFGRPDPEFGQRIEALVVTACAELPLDLGEHLAARLAGFKRPRALLRVAELPLLPNGKVDRRAAARLGAPR